MFYQFYEMNHAALQPARAYADAVRMLYSNPLNPLSHTTWGRSVAAMAELFERTDTNHDGYLTQDESRAADLKLDGAPAQLITTDGLAALPRDYTGVPRDVPPLGPPLPGDLGRPIVRAQERGQPVVPPGIQPTVDAAEQRRLAEAEAARTSRVFFQTQARTVAASTAPGSAATTPNLTGLGLPGQFNTPTAQERAQERQLAFLNAAADRRTVAPDRVMPPASPYVLQAGAVIPAALITGIRSDLPGQITARRP